MEKILPKWGAHLLQNCDIFVRVHFKPSLVSDRDRSGILVLYEPICDSLFRGVIESGHFGTKISQA